LAMAVGGLFSAGGPDAATEFSSVTFKQTPHTDLDRSAAQSLIAPPRLTEAHTAPTTLAPPLP
jgi:hypothetical protein